MTSNVSSDSTVSQGIGLSWRFVLAVSTYSYKVSSDDFSVLEGSSYVYLSPLLLNVLTTSLVTVVYKQFLHG